MLSTFTELFSRFQVEGTLVEVEMINNGHINDSYKLHVENSTVQHWFLQRINSSIFQNTEGLMQNVDLVTRHLHEHVSFDARSRGHCLRLVKTREDALFCKDAEGYAWRMYNYLDNSMVYDRVYRTEQARETGRMFGTFVMQLADLDPGLLVETIPDFHDLDYRWKLFNDACKEEDQRNARALAEIAFVKSRYNEMSDFYNLIRDGRIPKRITHNDTKINNIIFDMEGTGMCIIDLDTVMPGSVLFDFGDAIRTIANTAAEDETDLSKVTFNTEWSKAYTQAYLDACSSTLTSLEIQNLPESARYMTFLIGLRFLTDYLAGDVYYKTTRPGHNLDRARVQFAMVGEIERHKKLMQDITHACVKKP